MAATLRVHTKCVLGCSLLQSLSQRGHNLTHVHFGVRLCGALHLVQKLSGKRSHNCVRNVGRIVQ